MTTKCKTHVQWVKRSGELPHSWLEEKCRSEMTQRAQGGTSSSCSHRVWTELVWLFQRELLRKVRQSDCPREGCGNSSPNLMAPGRVVGAAHPTFLSNDGSAGLGTTFWELFSLPGFQSAKDRVAIMKQLCKRQWAGFKRFCMGKESWWTAMLLCTQLWDWETRKNQRDLEHDEA